MPATDLLRGGHVKEALASLEGDVRKDPSNSRFRVFLFQLLSVTGAWDRAATQLAVAGDLDAASLPMVAASLVLTFPATGFLAKINNACITLL